MLNAPETVSVPAESLGLVIGRGGSTIKRLIQSTGCQIEVPRSAGKKDDGEGIVDVKLTGNAEQCRLASEAIKDIAKGGDAEDHAARAEGAMVISHDLDNFDREAWVAWRLVATEKEHGVHVDTGRRALRVWATGGKPLRGEKAEKVRAAVEGAIEAARELVEIIVEANLEHEPENAGYDTAVLPLVEQYGVKVWAPRPENGVVPIKIVGPDEPARDVAALYEARYVKGKFTASVLQVPGQVQSMSGQMSSDYESDVRALESEFRVKVTQSRTLLWVAGPSAEHVAGARETIRDMLTFYFPSLFFLRKDLHPSAVDWIRTDEEMRLLRANPDCVLVLDDKEGSAWICGKLREAVQKRIEQVLERWSREHWEHDLEDYGAAMWLLGPKGSGDYVGRMQAESGAKIKVCPNQLKVIIEGKPEAVKFGSKLVLEGLERLAEKKRLNPPTEPQPGESVDAARAALAKFHHMLKGRGNSPSPVRGKGKGKGKAKASNDAAAAAPEELPPSRSTILRASDIYGAAAGPRGPAQSAAAAQRASSQAEPPASRSTILRASDIYGAAAGPRGPAEAAAEAQRAAPRRWGGGRDRSRSRDRPQSEVEPDSAPASAQAGGQPGGAAEIRERSRSRDRAPAQAEATSAQAEAAPEQAEPAPASVEGQPEEEADDEDAPAG